MTIGSERNARANSKQMDPCSTKRPIPEELLCDPVSMTFALLSGEWSVFDGRATAQTDVSMTFALLSGEWGVFDGRATAQTDEADKTIEVESAQFEAEDKKGKSWRHRGTEAV